MRFLPEAWSEFGSAAQTEAGIQGGVWNSIGPGNIGGRIRSIVIHPDDPDIMWAGGVSGGVWKTTNGGLTSWSTNTDLLANLAVNCMVIDPTNPDILYAGTGEGFLNPDRFQGNGIFKTTDGGTSWNKLPYTIDNPDFYFVNRLAVSPTNPQLLLAATTTGIFRTTDGGDQWFPVTGLPAVAWGDVDFRPNSVPGDGPNFFNCLAGSLDGRIYYSTDDGVTWQTSTANPLPIPHYLRRVEVAYSRSHPWIAYASFGEADGDPSLLFYSENGGVSFTSLGHPQDPTNPNLGGANWYANTLWVDPTDPNTIVVGGYYLPLLRTRDRGAHWEEAWRGSHPDQHVIVEHPDYTGASGNNKIVYLGSDGGIHRTEDILATITPPPPGGSVLWESRNHSLGVTQFYGGAGHAATGRIIGGTQDNGTVRFQPSGGPENWDTMVYGDGGFCAIDQPPVDPPYFYGEYINLQIYRNTTNQGSKLYYIWGGPGHPNGIPAECGETPCANFTAPFVLDPNNTLEEHRMLAGGRSLWRSTNARTQNSLAVAWSPIKGPAPQNCVATNNCININAVAVAEGFSDLIWVGYNDGSVAYTTDGTTATPFWHPGDSNNLLPGGQPNIDERLCTRITIGQGPVTNNPQIVAERPVYITFGGFFPSTTDTRGNIWKREIDGVTWTPIHNNLPSTPVYSLVISPSNPNFLYVGTEVGVFASANGGGTWSPAFGGSSADTLIYSLVVSASATSSPDIIYAGTEEGVFASKDDGATWLPGFGGPANTRVAELFWMGPTLVSATHGRGMFTISPPSL